MAAEEAREGEDVAREVREERRVGSFLEVEADKE